jgi:hypothetical protein
MLTLKQTDLNYDVSGIPDIDIRVNQLNPAVYSGTFGSEASLTASWFLGPGCHWAS